MEEKYSEKLLGAPPSLPKPALQIESSLIFLDPTTLSLGN